MGWKTGFEPATSGTTIQRSNQLSYNHHFKKSFVSILVSNLRGLPVAVRNSSHQWRRQRYFFL